MKNNIRTFSVLVLAVSLFATLHAQTRKDSLYTYYSAAEMGIGGRIQSDSAYEHPYDRFPLYMKEKVRKAVWDLAKNTAGVSIRFATNSGSIKLKWKVLNDLKMNHMAETGIKGVDIYYSDGAGKWVYLNTARPKGIENEYVVLKNAASIMREYKLYLPLYDGVTELYIGVTHDAVIQKQEAEHKKPIVFYGTSITQGGCASRPGMAYPAIIEREMGVPVINLGFSGNGRMEEPVAEFMAGCDASLYVIDCAANMTSAMLHESVAKLVTALRKNRRETPILFIDGFNYTYGALDDTTAQLIAEKNKAMRDEITKLQAAGIKGLYVIGYPQDGTFPGEGAVDGVHLTDHGFYLFAKFFEEGLRSTGLDTKLKNTNKREE